MSDHTMTLPAAARASRRRTPAPPPNPAAANALAGVAGMGLAVTVLVSLSAESLHGLGAPGAALIALGRLTGMVAAYGMLLIVLLVARLPVVERVAGHDKLVAWHRRLGPWTLGLVAAHGVLITVGYAAQARTGVLAQLWTLLSSYPGVLAGTVAFVLLLAAGVSSYRLVRRRMAYETWWSVHLYTYLALFLAFSHQVATGAMFVGHPVARAAWTALWVGGAALVLCYRVGVPLARSLRHRLRVEEIREDAPGVASIVLRGRHLDRLPVDGGQFLQWRFLRRGLWWQAHPYSLSALPHDGRLRLTVKDLGDHSRALARLRPGTWVAFEGPYGAFTKHARRGDRVLLAGAGVGVAPIRTLLEDLPRDVDTTVLVRASTTGDLVLRDELRALARRRGAELHELVGHRQDVPLNRAALQRLVPDLADRDVYLCGPDGFMSAVAAAAREAGVPADHIHHEEFAF